MMEKLESFPRIIILLCLPALEGARGVAKTDTSLHRRDGGRVPKLIGAGSRDASGWPHIGKVESIVFLL